MNVIRHRPWPPIILIAFVILASLYSVATPIFEASDEVSHYAVVQHLADTGELPVQQPGVKAPWDQEGSQPPLYYLLVSPIARLIDTRDAAERMYRNPHAAPGDPSLDANRNLVIHSPAENFPWHNTVLAVHLIRFISIMLSAGTIVVGYLIARRIFPDPLTRSIPIGAAALIAFNPMFIFISASVNNDNLTILLTSLALYLSVLCWQEPPGRVRGSGWTRRLLLGIVLGGAALSKLSGLTLLPIVALMLTVRHLRQRDWRGWILSGLLIALPVLIMAGWWYVRNVQLYGELFGLDTMIAIAGPRTKSLLDLVPEFDGFRYSYWALFGAFNIVTFPLAYVVFDLFTLIGAIGCTIWFVRRGRIDRDRAVVLSILAAYVLLVFVGVIRWTMMTPASQGRLMFPAITVISLLLWLGWETAWSAPRWALRKAQPPRGASQGAEVEHPERSEAESKDARLVRMRWMKWTFPVFMLVTAIVAPFRDIAPTYEGPPLITVGQLPTDLQQIDVDYGDQLRLIGYRRSDQPTQPGAAEFTLYWQCLKSIDADYSVFVIVYGRQMQEVGKRDAYPYHGLYATRQCAAGQIFVDPYRIPLGPQAERPTILRAQIGLKDQARQTELNPSTGSQVLPALIVSVGQLASTSSAPQPQHAARYRLGDTIELLGYDLPQLDRERSEVRYRLYWHRLPTSGHPLEDYTVFAHLLSADGRQIGQGDSQPFAGDYPTSLWQPGETFVEERWLKVDPGALTQAAQLALGLYRLEDGARLPVIDSSGARVPDDQIILPVQP